MSYIQPSSTQQFPGQLTLNQFIQTVLAGISDIPGAFVRPKWQVDPPKNPDIDINWIAFGVSALPPDANGYLGVDGSGNSVYQRQEGIEVSCSIYGPDTLGTYGLLRDGFQIPQNRDVLTSGNMGFTSIGPPLHIPDLVNERFVDRVETSIFFRRQIQRTYAIPNLISAHGTIHTVLGNEQYLLDWET